VRGQRDERVRLQRARWQLFLVAVERFFQRHHFGASVRRTDACKQGGLGDLGPAFRSRIGSTCMLFSPNRFG
jgi:hypothetical protein